MLRSLSFRFCAIAGLVLAGCSVAPPPTYTIAQAAAAPLPPPAVLAAVGRFREDHPGWHATWNRGSGMPRLTGPGFRVPGLPRIVASATGTIAGALAAAVAPHQDVLGLHGLDVRLQSGGRAGNVWFLRGALQRDGVAVVGRIDCGITVDGDIVLLSSDVSPAAATLPSVQPRRTAAAAAAVAAAAAGLTADQADKRIDVSTVVPVVWWDQLGRGSPPARLAWRVAIATSVGDALGGIRFIDDEEAVELQVVPGARFAAAAAAVVGAPRAPVAGPPGVPQAAVLGGDLEDAVVVRAPVRIGAGALASVSFEPMPLLALKWLAPSGIATPLATDDRGRLSIAAVEGDTFTTEMAGGWLDSTDPALEWKAVLGKRPVAGQPWYCDFVDASGGEELLDRATVRHWLRRANEAMAAVTGAIQELQWMRGTATSYGGTECSAAFYRPSNLHFSANGGACSSWACDTIIVHEWAHLFDAFCGGTHDEGAAEAYADIIAMFFTGEPRIGNGCTAGGGYLRDGSIRRTPADPVLTYGHAGEPLMTLAWRVRKDLLAAFGDADGATMALSLFVGQLAATPATVGECIARAFLVAEAEADLDVRATVLGILKQACLDHGLGG